eukprot:UN32393
MESAGLRRYPWKDWAEWRSVKNAIFDNNEKHKWAVSMMNMWSSRTNKLPSAIEITRDLVQYSLEKNVEHQTKRLILAAIYIRLVNGFTDPLQKGAVSRTVGAISSQIKMPQIFVEIRHTATHRQLPSLELLEENMNKIYKFIRTYYWEKQEENISVKEKKNLLK